MPPARSESYCNAPGGKHLYERGTFAREGIELRFVAPRAVEYRQFGTGFIPSLSILDVLMFNGPGEVRAMLDEYDLE